MASDNIRGDLELLHRPESGTPDLNFGAGAVTYAKHLARYVTCASTIRAYVKSNYGVSLAIDKIEGFRAEHREVRKRYQFAAESLLGEPDDRRDFRVAGRVKAAKPPIPAPEPEPIEVDVPSQRIVPPRIVTDIIAEIAVQFGMTAADILGRNRSREVVEARKTVAWVLVKRGNSFASVGAKLKRDHSSIIHAVKSFEATASDKMREVAAELLGEQS